MFSRITGIIRKSMSFLIGWFSALNTKQRKDKALSTTPKQLVQHHHLHDVFPDDADDLRERAEKPIDLDGNPAKNNAPMEIPELRKPIPAPHQEVNRNETNGDGDRDSHVPDPNENPTSPSQDAPAVAIVPARERERASKAKKSNEPREHGGRRIECSKSKKATAGTRNTERIPPPELICREGHDGWEIVLKVSREKDSNEVVEVLHNDTHLNASKDEYPITKFTGTIVVNKDDGRTEISLFKDGEPLIFRMLNNWNGNGHRVRGVAFGYFIVIAPCDRKWKTPKFPHGGWGEHDD